MWRINRLDFFVYTLVCVNLLSTRSGKYTYVVNLIFFGILFAVYRVKLTKASCAFYLIGFILTFIGLAEGNIYTSIIEDILNFTPLIYLIIFDRNFLSFLKTNLISYLANLLYIMLPVGLAFYWYMEYSPADLLSARFNYNEEVKLEFFSPIIPISYATMLIFFLPQLELRQKIIVHLCNLSIVLFGLITLSKSVILNILIAYMLFYSYVLTVERINIKRIFISLIIILASVYFAKSMLFNDENGIAATIQAFGNRIESQLDRDDISSGRIQEAHEYLSQRLSLKEYLIGRGYGGQKVQELNKEFIGGVNMMHFGPLHTFLKGGLLLTLILYLLPAFAIRKYLGTENYSLGLVLVWIMLVGLQTTNWVWGIFMFFYWYSLVPYLMTLNKRRIS